MKMVVHGYFGYKASKEIEQFLTFGELRRIAHYVDGVWIAPTRSTFKSYLPDVFPEKPYVIHQNSPLAWGILSYIHQVQDESPLKRASTNLHRQKNTLYLESLKYGMILHAKRILKTIEEGCMRCLRRRKKYLKQRIGQPLEASFKSDVRPFQYVQMDLTGRHVSSDGKDVYGLVCVCLQTYNTKIYGIESRKLEAVSLAIEVLTQEVGPPDFIA